MAKKPGFKPFILMDSGTPGDEVVIGGGSGQGGSDPFPMSYKEWAGSAWSEGYDIDGSGDFSHEEFAWWWVDNGFSVDDWTLNNPDIPWDPAWNNE